LRDIHNIKVSLSSPTHWSELKCTFKDKYPYFEEFKIRLPHAKNNYVQGVGRKEKVEEFYSMLKQLGVIDKLVDFESYKIIGEKLEDIEPIPEGFVVAYISEIEDGVVYSGFVERREFFRIGVDGRIPEALIGLLVRDDLKIITNNGKWLAKKLLQRGFENIEINDVLLNEKIIANGEVSINFRKIDDLLERYAGYSGEDHVLVINQMFNIWQSQDQVINRDKLRAVVELENQTLWVIAKMESYGMKVDGDRLVNCLITCEEKMNGLRERLRIQFPPELDPTKDDDQTKFLNQTFGLDLKDNQKESLSHISDSEPREVIDVILKFRNYRRLKQIAENFWEHTGAGDRIYIEAKQLGTVTGRINRGFILILPKNGPLRSFIVPAAGYKFVIADYSQFEARIALGLAQDKNGLAIFQAQKDIYLEFAKFITGKSGDEVGEYRKVAKGIVLGLLNGETEFPIQQRLMAAGINLSLGQVGRLIDKFHDFFLGLKNWQDSILIKAKEDGYVESALGRRRYLEKILGEDKVDNQIRNFPIQGTASDGFKGALCELDRKFQELGLDAHLVLTVHDEILVEVKDDEVEEVQGIIEDCLKNAFKEIIPEMPFELDMRIADSWGK
jgi:DNA polymerase I-like protein with 3'-5' exonuclease and polymerase domains